MRSRLCRAATTAATATRRSQTACFHCTARTWAIAHPITAHGPPPKPPTPAAEFKHDPRRAPTPKQTEAEIETETTTSKQKQTPSQTQTTPDSNSAAARVAQAKSALRATRFWKDVHVTEHADGYQVLLDTRPVRIDKSAVLTVPSSKRHLAEAIALEWDCLATAQQALKRPLIPLTSLFARAADIAREDETEHRPTRHEIVAMAMRYLETDTLLCWVPEKEAAAGTFVSGPGETAAADESDSLRDVQRRVAEDIIGFLTRTAWPGVELKPVLDESSILPAAQSPNTLDIIQSWVAALPAYELAGLEAGMLASKSVLVAARLVVEWGEHFATLQQTLPADRARFGVEAAAQAASLEVAHQTGMWGEVEDTHDVDREDLRRQLGSVILLVSGEREE